VFTRGHNLEMKKIFLSLLVASILLLTGLQVMAKNHEEKETYELRITFSKPTIVEEKQYITIDVEGTNNYNIQQGKPLLPCYTETIRLPFKTKITSITYTQGDIKTQTVSKKIQPSPLAVSLDGTQEIQQQDVSYTFEQYPEETVDYQITSGIYKDKRYTDVKLIINPVEYNPHTNTITYTRDINVAIETEPPEKTTMNYEENYPFVILTADQFEDELQPLVTHKNNIQQLQTKQVTLTEIYNGDYFPAEGRDEAEQIKYFIKNAIDYWQTNYVLLVGGQGIFPNRETHITLRGEDPGDDDREVFVSDLYFADIYDGEGQFASWDSNNNSNFAEVYWGNDYELFDDMDYNPDIYIGRLPALTSEQVATVVNKIIDYETNKNYETAWFSNMIFVGGDSFPGDGDQRDEGEYVNQHIYENYMSGFIPDKIWVTNDRLTGYNGVGEINNAIKKGAGFIDFSGHGNTNVWATHPHENHNTWLPKPGGGYYSSNIGSLTNSEKLPVIITGACSVAKYNKNDNCFTWAWLANPNGGGIAACGASALGYVYLGEWIVRGLVEGMTVYMFKQYHEGAITIGEMWGNALNTYIDTIGNLDAGDSKTLAEWHLFGDPTLAIRDDSMPPNTPDKPTGPTTGKKGEKLTYQTKTTDPENDSVYYLFDWGDDTTSGWIGPFASGTTITANHTYSIISEEPYQIRVKAKDIHGVQGAWSEGISVTIPKTRTSHLTIMEWFLHHLSVRFPLLRQILVK
jgi:hypothetical protein